MNGKSKPRKRGIITEDDISTLLQRYTATTVLALLQEVAQCEGLKIDWNALVKKTTTGISNATEYQMLWRHLAYRHGLLHKLDDEAQPLDDDSDLDYELDAYPDVGSEATAEAAACVKVLIASGLSRDSSHPKSSTVEAPLTINIPNDQSFRAPWGNSQPAAARGMNITVPVSVQKQPLPGEGLDGNGSRGTVPARKKRKPWSAAEDKELIAAVQEYGEGNWSNILRGGYKGDRTASQLSQRWAILRKRLGNLNLGANSSGSQLSEAQQAARHAMQLALDRPAKISILNKSGEALPAQHQSNRHPIVTKSTSVASLDSAAKSQATLEKTANPGLSSDPVRGRTTLPNMAIHSVPPTTTAEASPAQHQPVQHHVMTKSSSMASLESAEKSQVMLEKTSAKSSLNSDPVRAAAVAAGARIVSQSDAASLLKAAKAKNVVHIMPTGGSSSKPSTLSVTPSHLEAHLNVRSSSSGPASAPLSTRLAVSPSGLQPRLMMASSPTNQHTPSTSVTSLNMSTERANVELPPRQVAKTAEGTKISGPEGVTKEQIQEDAACALGNEPSKQIQENKAALPNEESEFKSQVDVAESSNPSLNFETTGSDMADAIGNQTEGSQNANDNKIIGLSVKKGENQNAVPEHDGNQTMSDKQADLPGMVTDDCSKKLEAISKAESGNGMLEREG